MWCSEHETVLLKENWYPHKIDLIQRVFCLANGLRQHVVICFSHILGIGWIYQHTHLGNSNLYLFINLFSIRHTQCYKLSIMREDQCIIKYCIKVFLDMLDKFKYRQNICRTSVPWISDSSKYVFPINI